MLKKNRIKYKLNEPKSPVSGLNKKGDEELFNMNEVRHLAVNYAITCEKGYQDSFDNWYNHISSDWRKIANKKITG